MRKAEESRPRGRHLRAAAVGQQQQAAPVQANEFGWSERTRFLDLNIHITGVQYLRTHPTGSRRPKTALLAVSRSMHCCASTPTPPSLLTHSRTHSLTRSVVTQQRIINRPGGEGGCNPRPGLGRSHKANGGKKRDLVRRARESEGEGERERHRRSVDQVSGTFGWFTECSQPASQPAGLSLASAAAVVQECM